MRFLPLVLLFAAPAFAAPHSGVPKVRTAPELSDVALFAMAVLGVWIVRRAMRVRFARKAESHSKD